MDTRIKEPCPICGTPVNEIKIETFKIGKKNLNRIICPNCRLTFDWYGNKQTVIDKWNLRYR